MKYIKRVNGIDVEAEYSDESVRDIFLPLLEHLTALQKKEGRRILVMLAAPPAAGKSTLVSFLQKLSEDTPGLTPLQAIGMDGFHRYQDYLTSHSVTVDGEDCLMVKVKGSPITFDLDKLTERIKAVIGGGECAWPEYNRMLHNPVEGAIRIERDIILLEGNYLLLDEPGWRELKNYADYTLRITAEPACLRRRLIDRKAASNGMSDDEAAVFVDFSDMRNVRQCIADSVPGDLNLLMLPDGSYVRE